MHADRFPGPMPEVERPLDKTDRVRLVEVERILCLMTARHDSISCKCRLCDSLRQLACLWMSGDRASTRPTVRYIPRRPGGNLGDSP